MWHCGGCTNPRSLATPKAVFIYLPVVLVSPYELSRASASRVGNIWQPTTLISPDLAPMYSVLRTVWLMVC
ncbi:hypothetical protein ASPBRDRAFT_38831 [Aspergillus brasiliensis CBS 101740]|uniref:Uncharacterized protein n=1 Tax=Aspergillus brasiliensis (strain CBS 101740 / IMI 381727 / IBT 21946) TaxID=767769 RepID=A0A1L9UXF7_ASPBC|nr:hypothetical protein ASPBRDRAFT_38831 [Aspergillus brasiliensis CBS 101740]